MSALDALQGCLAAEHAAVFGYGIVGGVLAGVSGTSNLQAYAEECYAVHRGRRDSLTSLVTRLGETPVAAEPAYRLPFRVTGVDPCKRLARQLENRTAIAYALAVAHTVSTSRAMAVDALTDCAIRSADWGTPLQALPGIGPS
ncbi:MAG: ferritin-like domain-containing protein [Propionibacteriales bacterium]|nr:ferritin-like domain-containing protein [Propionibacteriales bacterium]